MPTIFLRDQGSLPIHFEESKEPKLDAIYIKDIEEFYSLVAADELSEEEETEEDKEKEVEEEEIKSLMVNINKMLGENKVPSLIDIPPHDFETVADLSDEYIKNSPNNIKLLLQKQAAGYDLSAFLKESQEKKCETVYLGGIYGRGCVWDRARRISRNIYAKQLGDPHPNERFYNQNGAFVFTNGVIVPSITQGYFHSDEGNPTFENFIKFKPTKEQSVPMETNGQIFASAVDKIYSTELNTGKFYADNYSINVTNSSHAMHIKLFNEIQKTLQSMEKLKQVTSTSPTSSFSSSSNSSDSASETVLLITSPSTSSFSSTNPFSFSFSHLSPSLSLDKPKLKRKFLHTSASELDRFASTDQTITQSRVSAKLPRKRNTRM